MNKAIIRKSAKELITNLIIASSLNSFIELDDDEEQREKDLDLAEEALLGFIEKLMLLSDKEKCEALEKGGL